MQVEAAKLRLADVVRVVGDGEREITKIEKNGDVRVWFRGDDLEQPATRVAELGEAFEIQRPGDLFVTPPPKNIQEAYARVFERMAALGWTVTPDGVGLNSYVTDPTDTIRLKLKLQAVALQVRWFDKGSWRWKPKAHSLGEIKAFATNLDEEVPRLIRIAREEAQKRSEADHARIDREPEAVANDRPAADAAEAVVIRYSLDQGVLLGGATKAHKDAIKALANPYRFRYSRNLPGDAAWYVPRSRSTYQPRSRVEQLAEALRRRGVPVVVEYTEAANDAAAQAVEPDTEAASDATASETQLEPDESSRKVGRPPDNAKRAERLRALAAKMAASADEKINADRQENTPRRARMAAGIRDDARRALVMAETIRLAADAVEQGEFEYVARIGTAAEVEALDLQLRRGVWERNRRESRRQDEPNREPEDEDIDYATFPDVVAYSDGLRMTVEASSGLPGIAEARRRIERLSKRPSSERLTLRAEDVDALRQVITAIRRDDASKMPGGTSVLDEEIKTIDRLGRIGVRDTATLRAALREYKQCCRGRVEKKREDPIAAKKRELQFAKIPGYFPTPRPLAERLVEAAEIGLGDRVLEPSAGSGSLAEVIRERHPDARLDLVERNYSLREILTASGFNLVGYDFLAYEPREPYTRIVMNPPFENRQDVEHIQHALAMLEPGGRLVAIAGAGLSFREDAATAGLRERINKLGGRIEPLPEQSFQESGTNVNTVMVVVDKPREAVVVPKPVEVQPPQLVAKTKPKRSPLADRWTSHITSRVNDKQLWENLAKTSCFVRKEGDVSVTLCPAIQNHVVGDCPPSDAGVKSKNKQLMLCQVDEEVEYFRGFTAGIQQAKAEAENRIARGRVRLGQAPVVPPLPAVDDFEGQERYLDAIIPSRVVYSRDAPLSPIWVSLAEPHVVLPDGSTQALGKWEGELAEQPTYQLRVWAGKDQTVDEFVAQLGKDLIPYRGPVGPSTLGKVVGRISNDARVKLVAAGVTLHDVQHGHFAGQTVYWLRAPDDSEIFGPISATGDLVKNQKVLDEFEFNRDQHGDQSQPLPTLPPGWTLDDTIVAAVLLKGRRFWVAYQPSTENFTTKGEGDEWAKFQTVPKQAPFDADKGYEDFVNRFSWTMTKTLGETPMRVRFRVAGPWLGAVFPTDFGKRITFDPPTGGTVDIAELEESYARVLEGAQVGPEHILATHWLKLMQQRIAWAKAWLRKQGAAERKIEAETRAKEKADMKAKKAGKKKSTDQKTAEKKAAEQKAAEQKAAEKKAGAEKKAAEQKATEQKAAAKKAEQKAAAKKAGPKAATKKAEPKAATKKAEPKAAAKKAATSKTNGHAAKPNGHANANGHAAKPNGHANGHAARPNGHANGHAARSNGHAAKPNGHANGHAANGHAANGSAANGHAAKLNGHAANGHAPKPNGHATKPVGSETSQDDRAEHQRRLQFRRNDIVRFRKRSQIAKGLGVNLDTLYTVEMVTTHEGRPVVVLRHGRGNHLALMKIPPGHLAVVQRAEQIPNEILACAARLAQYDGPISPKTRRLLAELARRS